MGHKSVTTTELYSEMNLKRVKDDFPTIFSRYVNQNRICKKDTLLKDTTGLPISYQILTVREFGLLLWEQEIGSSNLSTPTLEQPISSSQEPCQMMRLLFFIYNHIYSSIPKSRT